MKRTETLVLLCALLALFLVLPACGKPENGGGEKDNPEAGGPGTAAAPQLDTGTFGILQLKVGGTGPNFPTYPTAWAWKPKSPADREIWLLYKQDVIESGNAIGFIRPGDDLRRVSLQFEQIIRSTQNDGNPGTTDPSDGIDQTDIDAFKDWVIQRYNGLGKPGVKRSDLTAYDHTIK